MYDVMLPVVPYTLSSAMLGANVAANASCAMRAASASTVQTSPFTLSTSEGLAQQDRALIANLDRSGLFCHVFFSKQENGAAFVQPKLDIDGNIIPEREGIPHKKRRRHIGDPLAHHETVQMGAAEWLGLLSVFMSTVAVSMAVTPVNDEEVPTFEEKMKADATGLLREFSNVETKAEAIAVVLRMADGGHEDLVLETLAHAKYCKPSKVFRVIYYAVMANQLLSNDFKEAIRLRYERFLKPRDAEFRNATR